MHDIVLFLLVTKNGGVFRKESIQVASLPQEIEKPSDNIDSVSTLIQLYRLLDFKVKRLTSVSPNAMGCMCVVVTKRGVRSHSSRVSHSHQIALLPSLV